MDPNTANQPITSQQVNPVPQPQPQPQPLTPPIQQQQPDKQGGRKWPKILIVLLVLVILVLGGYFAYTYYFAQSNTYNAGVYKEPQATIVSPTPTPSGYQANPADTTDGAIDSDTAQIDKNMTNLNSDINTVDQSVSDKQTNLQ